MKVKCCVGCIHSDKEGYCMLEEIEIEITFNNEMECNHYE